MHIIISLPRPFSTLLLPDAPRQPTHLSPWSNPTFMFGIPVWKTFIRMIFVRLANDFVVWLHFSSSDMNSATSPLVLVTCNSSSDKLESRYKATRANRTTQSNASDMCRSSNNCFGARRVIKVGGTRLCSENPQKASFFSLCLCVQTEKGFSGTFAEKLSKAPPFGNFSSKAEAESHVKSLPNGLNVPDLVADCTAFITSNLIYQQSRMKWPISCFIFIGGWEQKEKGKKRPHKKGSISLLPHCHSMLPLGNSISPTGHRIKQKTIEQKISHIRFFLFLDQTYLY